MRTAPIYHPAAFLASIIRAVALDPPSLVLNSAGTVSVWDAVVSAVVSFPVIFNYTPVVVAFKNGDRVECRQIARHNPPFTGWGIVFNSCRKGCDVQPSDISIRTRSDSVRTICLQCGWRSSSVRALEVEGLHELGNGLFWHYFPPSLAVRNTFVTYSAVHTS